MGNTPNLYSVIAGLAAALFALAAWSQSPPPRSAADILAILARAEALRQAMLHLIDSAGASDAGKPIYSYAHPMFWAPFSLVGDGN